MTSLSVQTIKSCCCPHGSSPGSCPICSGMGGGGAVSKRPVGEMSWSDCYSMGLMMKAARQNAELNKNNHENYLIQNALLNKIAFVTVQRAAEFKNFLLQLPATQGLTKAINNFNNTIKQVIKMISTPISTVNSFISKTMNMLKNGFIDISDKLAAIWGEKENALKKFTSDNIEKAKKRIFEFLGFVDETKKESEHADEVENQKRRDLNIGKFKYKITRIFQKIKEKKCST